jgi:hypothetical protein
MKKLDIHHESALWHYSIKKKRVNCGKSKSERKDEKEKLN